MLQLGRLFQRKGNCRRDLNPISHKQGNRPRMHIKLHEDIPTTYFKEYQRSRYGKP